MRLKVRSKMRQFSLSLLYFRVLGCLTPAVQGWLVANVQQLASLFWSHWLTIVFSHDLNGLGH